MSFLRLLSPVRAVLDSSSRWSKGDPDDDAGLTLRVEGYGTVIIPPPDDPLWPATISVTDRPRNDYVLQGELDVYVPPARPESPARRRRCRAVRVSLRTTARLNMGAVRGWEEDVIFEGKCEMLGGTSEGLWLDEGVQRFAFALILPSTLSPQDWHHNGTIDHELIAELDGLSAPSSASRGSFPSRPGSIMSGKAATPTFAAPSRSPSQTPPPQLTLAQLSSSHRMSPLLNASMKLSTSRQEATTSQVPNYQEFRAEAEGETPGNGKHTHDGWIRGKYTAKRSIMVMHNPNRHGAHSELDEIGSDFAPGLGVYHLDISSDMFTVGAFIHIHLTIPDMSPKAVVFSWRPLFVQTHAIQSPRDDPVATEPIPSTRYFSVIEYGRRPPKGMRNPGIEHQALWRGVEAGGTDENSSYKTEGNGPLPKYDSGRPSTLPGIVTPIQVSHSLVFELYFSRWGETDRGEPMDVPGPGGLRYMKVQRPVILPACALTPLTLNLPQYSSTAPAFEALPEVPQGARRSALMDLPNHQAPSPASQRRREHPLRALDSSNPAK